MDEGSLHFTDEVSVQRGSQSGERVLHRDNQRLHPTKKAPEGLGQDLADTRDETGRIRSEELSLGGDSALMEGARKQQEQLYWLTRTAVRRKARDMRNE